MRIAYITPYQGPTLEQRRPIAKSYLMVPSLNLGRGFTVDFGRPSYLTPTFRFIMSRLCLLDESMASGPAGRRRAFLRSDIGYVRSIS